MADPTIADTLRELHARGIIARWVLPGMRLVDDGAARSWVVIYTDDEGAELTRDDLRPAPGEVCDADFHYWEDVETWRLADDPVTVAALIVLVREAWDTPALVPTRERDAGWVIADGLCSSTMVGGRYLRGPTELDAMHAALRARLEVTP